MMNPVYTHMIWTLVVLTLPLCIARQRLFELTMNISLEESNTPLSNIVLLPGGGGVIVAGKNAIYKLSSDLHAIQHKLETGPVMDNIDCLPPDEECPKPRELSDNYNKLLLLVPRTDVLLVCGSVWQGMCNLTSTADLSSRIIGDKKISSSFIASRNSTVAFFSQLNNSTFLLVASEYDDRPLLYHTYSVSSRRIILGTTVRIQLAHQSKTAVSQVNISHKYKNTYRVKYLYGFTHNGFAYFVIILNIGKAQDRYETRLARVCLKDPTYFTYTEVPLSCKHYEKDYRIATAASFWNSELRVKRDAEDENAALYVAFSEQNIGRVLNIDRNSGSVLCKYSMAKVERAFRDAVNECNKGTDISRQWMFFDDATELPCRQFVPRNVSDLCIPGENYFILGYRKLVGITQTNIPRVKTTSVLILEQNGTVIAWLGDDDGFLHKINVHFPNPRSLMKVDITDGEHTAIGKSFAVTPDGASAYFLTGRKVVKFPVGSCSIYQTCGECMKATEDPLTCGWCGTYCARASECHNASAFDMHKCPVVIRSVSPTSGPIKGGTLVTILGENFGSSQHPGDSSIRIQIGGKNCAIHTWEYNRVMCVTSPVPEEKEGKIIVAVNDTLWTDEKHFDVKDVRTADVSFFFQNPRFEGIQPHYGPYSGGTNITVNGKHLDIGANQAVFIGESPCKVYEITGFYLKCTTGPFEAAGSGLELQYVHVKIDGSNITRDIQKHLSETFTFMPDPQITSFEPDRVLFSADVKLILNGINFNSIFKSFLMVNFTVLEKWAVLTETCQIENENGSIMSCLLPSIYRNTEFSSALEFYHKPVQASLSFIMDGVTNLTLNSSTVGEKLLDFKYYPDPVFETLGTNESPSEININKPVLKLTGNRINSGLRRTLTMVNIGGYPSACNITLMTTDTLRCDVIKDQFNTGLVYNVQVVAEGKEFDLGYIKFVAAEVSSNAGLIAGIVVAVLIFILSLLIFYVVMRYRKKQKPLQYNVHFQGNEGGRRSERNGAVMEGTDNSDGVKDAYVTGTSEESRQSLMTSQPFQVDDDTMQLLIEEKLLYQRELLTLGPVIGRGHFGCVYRGVLELAGKENSISVAVKTLHNNSRLCEQDAESFLQEALIMKDFHHQNVIPLIGICFEADSYPLVIIPYMKYGDLLSYIRNEENSPTVKDLMTFGIHISEGMNYLSGLKFVHRDLAARNCMLSEDFIVRVADFGLSRDVYERDYYSSDNKKTKLPVKWMAPESLEKGIYNSKTDVWSYGVVLWELMTRGITPYPEVDNWDVVNFLKQGRRMQQPSYCPDMLYEIMLRCWAEDPKERPTFEVLVQEVADVITCLKKNKNKKVGLKVTYVNYPSRPDDAPGETSV